MDEGTGASTEDAGLTKCETCKGYGQFEQMIGGGPTSETVDCPDCRGTGVSQALPGTKETEDQQSEAQAKIGRFEAVCKVLRATLDDRVCELEEFRTEHLHLEEICAEKDDEIKDLEARLSRLEGAAGRAAGLSEALGKARASLNTETYLRQSAEAELEKARAERDRLRAVVQGMVDIPGTIRAAVHEAIGSATIRLSASHTPPEEPDTRSR